VLRRVGPVRDHDRDPLADEVVRLLVDLADPGRRQAGQLAGRDQRGIERVVDAGLERRVQVGEPQQRRRRGAVDVDDARSRRAPPSPSPAQRARASR